MNKNALIDLATSQLARLIMKLAAMWGAGTIVASSDKATQLASAVVTLAVFGIELIQSHYAHARAKSST